MSQQHNNEKRRNVKHCVLSLQYCNNNNKKLIDKKINNKKSLY